MTAATLRELGAAALSDAERAKGAPLTDDECQAVISVALRKLDRAEWDAYNRAWAQKQ